MDTKHAPIVTVHTQGAVTLIIEEQRLVIAWERPAPPALGTHALATPQATTVPVPSTLPAPLLEQVRTLRAQGKTLNEIIPILFTWTPTRGPHKDTAVPLDRRAGIIYQQKLAQLRVLLGEVGTTREEQADPRLPA